jgi:hypothetical protein
MSANRCVAYFVALFNQDAPNCARLNRGISERSDKGCVIILSHKLQQQTHRARWAFARRLGLGELVG